MNTHTHTHIHTHTHTHMYKYMYIHVKIVVMITDIGAEYGRGSARGAIAYNYIFQNNSYDFIYRSRVWQRKRARAFADTGGVDRIEEALQRQRCSVAGPFLMYVIVICFLIVSG